MNLISKSAVKNLLKKYNLRPIKGLGQNFLIDKRVIQKMMTAADLTSNDTVLEIGPGIGALTEDLAQRAGKVIAVEKDKRMVEILKETLKDYNNTKVVQDDVLKIENRKLEIGNPFKVVASLPFYLTAPVIRKFLEESPAPELMVLVIQKEVAQRICQKPPKMSLFAVSVQLYSKPEIISYISKKSFWPQPKVDAAILKITPESVPTPDVGKFFRIVKAGFSQPRKQLINNLSQGLKIDKKKLKIWLKKSEIQPVQRAETLTIKNWLRLTKTFLSLTR